MRLMVSALSLVIYVGVARGADGDAALDGKWVITSIERDGKADDAMLGAVRVQKGGDYTITRKDGKSIPGTAKTDASKKPKTIDVTPSEGTYKGKTLLGIYEVSGDKLKICFAEPGKDRPTEFSSKPGSGWVLAVHEKAK